jgi:hypothetical protein
MLPVWETIAILNDQRREDDRPSAAPGSTPKCDCCARGDEYNGFASGSTIFTCPKKCACHD